MIRREEQEWICLFSFRRKSDVNKRDEKEERQRHNEERRDGQIDSDVVVVMERDLETDVNLNRVGMRERRRDRWSRGSVAVTVSPVKNNAFCFSFLYVCGVYTHTEMSIQHIQA